MASQLLSSSVASTTPWYAVVVLARIIFVDRMVLVLKTCCHRNLYAYPKVSTAKLTLLQAEKVIMPASSYGQAVRKGNKPRRVGGGPRLYRTE